MHETFVDRFGYQRNSDGGYVKAGTSFELTRLVTGEISVGYTLRNYQDSRLDRLQGLLTSALVSWSVSPLTTAKFVSDTQVAESTLAGVPGVLVRTYTAEVDHDFRRWLTGIGRFTYGTLDYQGSGRFDQLYSISGDVIYKLSRSLWVKATLRRDWLLSNVSGGSSASTVAMLGIRLQNCVANSANSGLACRNCLRRPRERGDPVIPGIALWRTAVATSPLTLPETSPTRRTGSPRSRGRR